MPSLPLRSQVHIDTALTNVSVMYQQDAEDYVADQMFPTIPVKNKSGKYFVYDKGDFFRIEARRRAPGTESAGGGYRLSQASYSAERYALHKDVDDETRENTDTPLDADRDATIYVTQNLLLQRDLSFFQAFVAPAIWTTNLVGTTDFTKWNAGGSTPISNIRTQWRLIKKLTGKKANRLLLSRDVFDVLTDHPDLIDRIKYTERATGQAVQDIMGTMFGVEKVIVADAIYNAAKEGLTASMDFMVSGIALLAYANPSPSIMQPSAGYTFSWSKFDKVKKGGAAMKKFRMEEIESDRIEGDMYYDMRPVAPEAGVYFSSVI